MRYKSAPPSAEQVKANRQRFLAELHDADEGLQIQGQMFRSRPGNLAYGFCSEGVAVKTFLGIDNAHDYHAQLGAGRDIYGELVDLLGLDDHAEIYKLNDAGSDLEGFTEGHTFSEVADLLAAKWGLS